MATSARSIVQTVLPPRMVREIWSAQYDKVLPITFSGFELSAVLPAVFYMFRFGHRRGKGKFLETFDPESTGLGKSKRKTTIEQVAEKLSTSPKLEGFDGNVERAILGDFLLGFSLENVRHELGRDKKLQRVAPAHYMASWIDLPEDATHLRSVPEMIVAMLADQAGDYVEKTNSEKQTWFPVARDHVENLLLREFSQGVQLKKGVFADLAADKFDESFEDIGIDQLLMIRLAELLGAAPHKARGKEGTQKISNQHPIAENATRNFSEDIRRFVRSYASPIPRHAFVDMLEACIAMGMTTIFTSVVEILFKWNDTGKVTEKKNQRPTGVFVDCSNGVDDKLRSLAEESLDDFMRRVEHVPEILMTLRLLDYAARDNRKIKKKQIQTRPYATEWLNLLGDLLYKDNHEEGDYIHRQMDDYGGKLAEELREEYPEAAEMLSRRREENSVKCLAEALTLLLGTTARSNTIAMIDSMLNVVRPNGLAYKRKTTSGTHLAGGARRQREVRSIVFTDSVLDYLVHLHLLPSGNKQGVRSLSLKEFLRAICDRYGLYVDATPPDMTISNDLLRSNRMILERRLRDLGLLVGVNDAEAMKCLRPRFEPHIVGDN